MDLQNILLHMRGQAIRVNGRQYKLDDEGVAWGVESVDAHKLLQNREVWSTYSGGRKTPAPTMRKPPTLEAVKAAGYTDAAARSIVAGEEALAQGKTPSEAEALAKAALSRAQAAPQEAKPANPYAPSSETPAVPQEPKEEPAKLMSGEALGQYEEDPESEIPEEPVAGEEDQVEACADGEWPDPKETMTIGQLRQIADAYDVSYTKRTGKPRLVKDIMAAMYPEG